MREEIGDLYPGIPPHPLTPSPTRGEGEEDIARQGVLDLGLTDGKLALVKKDKTKIQLRDYSQRGASEDLGIQKTEKQQSFNVTPEKIGTAPSLIDILHRLLWLLENKPQEISNFIALAQPDTVQLRMVAQALAGRALTPEQSPLSLHSPLSLDGRGAGGEGVIIQRTQEQQAIDTLLASWKRVIEDNLFTRGGG